MKDKYFEKMGIPEDAACYVKCKYSYNDIDYFVRLNDKRKGFTFVDGDLIKDVKKNAKNEISGLVKAVFVNEINKEHHVLINGEGFGIPKKDVILVNKKKKKNEKQKSLS